MRRPARMTPLLILAAAGAMALTAARGAAAEPRPISLEEALRLASENAPRIVQARGESRTSAAGVRSSYAAFIPTLSLSAGASRQLPSSGDQTRIVDGQVVTIPEEPWSFSTGLGSSLELFDGGRRFHELSQAKAAARAAAAGEVAEEFNLALEVKREYFGVLAAREAETAARSTVEQAGQQLRAAVARLRTGNGTRSDSLRSEIQLNNARLVLLEARNGIENANASLTRIVGSPEPVTAAETSLEETAPLGVGDAELERLADRSPMVRQAEANLHMARAARRASRTPYLPTLSASYSYGGSGTDSRFGLGDDPFSYNGSLRFSLSYPVFNQLNREEQSARAAVALENAEAALRDARLAARQNQVQYLNAIRLAEQRVAAQRTSAAAAGEDLRMQQERYSLGASTLLDLLTSQAQLTATREELIRARYDLRVARAQLEALVGRSL